MLQAFGHHVVMCCNMFGVVGSNFSHNILEIESNTVFLSSYKNTSVSLGEQEMLGEDEP